MGVSAELDAANHVNDWNALCQTCFAPLPGPTAIVLRPRLWLVKRTPAVWAFWLSCRGKPVIGCWSRRSEVWVAWSIVAAAAVMVTPVTVPVCFARYPGAT